MWRKTVIEDIKEVETEWRAAARAVSFLQQSSRDNQLVLRDASVTPEDLRRCATNLEDTYFVRIFAVFEENLRDLWARGFQRTSVPKTEDLLNGAASHQHVKDDDLAHTHQVREYRNRIVHGGNAPVIPLPEARRYLCVFVGWMPPEW